MDLYTLNASRLDFLLAHPLESADDSERGDSQSLSSKMKWECAQVDKYETN